MKTTRRKPDNNSEEDIQRYYLGGKNKVTRLLIVVNIFHYKFILFEYDPSKHFINQQDWSYHILYEPIMEYLVKCSPNGAFPKPLPEV